MGSRKACTTTSHLILVLRYFSSSLLSYLGIKFTSPFLQDAYQSLQIRYRWHDEKYVYFLACYQNQYSCPPGILLYPSKMLYPGVLPLLSMFDALYEEGMAARKKLRVFYIVFSM